MGWQKICKMVCIFRIKSSMVLKNRFLGLDRTVPKIRLEDKFSECPNLSNRRIPSSIFEIFKKLQDPYLVSKIPIFCQESISLEKTSKTRKVEKVLFPHTKCYSLQLVTSISTLINTLATLTTCSLK